MELTLESKHDEPPLDVDTFIWLLPLSASLSPSPTAEDGRLCEDAAGRFPEDERFLVSEELLPAPLFSFWYSMGDWRAAITHRRDIYIPLSWRHYTFAGSPDVLPFFREFWILFVVLKFKYNNFFLYILAHDIHFT